MRIWLKPDRLAQLKLTPSDVVAGDQRAERAVRRRQGRPGAAMQRARTSSTRSPPAAASSDPKEFEQIIVRANPDGSIVRLADVARVELGSKDYEFIGRYNGTPATLIGIFLQPGANALAVAEDGASDDGRARSSASPRASPTRSRTTRRASSRCRSARCVLHARRGDAARVPRRVPVPAELARDDHPVRSRCRCR